MYVDGTYVCVTAHLLLNDELWYTSNLNELVFLKYWHLARNP